MKLYRHIIIFLALLAGVHCANAQVNTDQVLRVGQNALYFEDYMLSIQYFNQAIQAKPHLAQPYFYRAIAKLNLDDFAGAAADASKALELNPYLTDAWEVRGVARQNMGLNRLAIDDYTEALKLLPRNRSLLFNKSMALAELKAYDQARESLTELIKYYPGFDNAYLGRARVALAQNDTVAALADIDKALSINDKTVNGYILRADIAINGSGDFEKALSDIDHAIKLQPRAAGLYINRAFLRYRLDSYSGAMADYDYALTLDPLNEVALFNRAMLLMEVSANDLALDDLNHVLELNPDDVRALYNRALVNKAKGNYDAAVADITRVAERYPDFPGAMYLRGSIYRDQGKLARAEADFKKGEALTKALTPEVAERYDREIAAATPAAEGDTGSDVGAIGSAPAQDTPATPSASAVKRKFAKLLTVKNDIDFREEYNNTAIRGRVQDRNIAIDAEPMMMLSFYSSPNELQRSTYYIREVDDLNATRMLRFILVVTNKVPLIDEAAAARHFQSIDYYNSYLSTHAGRPVDYIGRALDFITVRDYANAEKDADRAIAQAPDLALGYLVRAQARYSRYLLGESGADAPQARDALARAAATRHSLKQILDDYDRVIELSPRMAVAWFNRGNILMEMEEFDKAAESFTKAVEIKPDFGEAFYNRGYLSLKNGHQKEGVDDLSKAGEMGIARAYNLIKRMTL